jgi:DNA-binding beta-propeller fold protein YncE
MGRHHSTLSRVLGVTIGTARRAVPASLASVATLLGITSILGARSLGAQEGGTEYRVLVANESSDLISVVRFGPAGLEVERDLEVGLMPADLDGAHGVRVSPDGRQLYVSLAHGTPGGKLWALDAETGALLDSTTVGRFPATIALTPDGSLALVVNFNLHGDPVPSSVSAVFTPEMQELARIETCVRPHGSRMNRAGTLHYSVCAGSDQLVEISIADLAVSRRVSLVPGNEMAFTGAGEHEMGHEMKMEMGGEGHEMGAEDQEAQAALPMIERHFRHHGAPGGGPVCGPTWVVSSHDDRHLYVACNKHNQVLEIDAANLQVVRRFGTGAGPYNLDATPNGRWLLVTNKADQSISVVDLATGHEAARVPTSRPVTHGIVATPDSRYAFVSNEAIGSTKGTVDVIDLSSLDLVASVEVHHQPGGIDFWR